MKLEGLTSIVTGGGRGIGRAITLALANEGADVTIIALRDLENATITGNMVEQLGHRALVLRADVTDKESVDRMVQSVLDQFGKIDLLVNSAGMFKKGPLEHVSVEDWDKAVAVNLKGVFLTSGAVAGHMIKQKKGNIINIIAASAHRCYPEGGAYGPSKAAVVNLTRQMALEWAKYNIRVNGISPGPILTPENETKMRGEEASRRIAKIPLARVGKPEEIGKCVIFLASEDSSYVTGQTFVVDGGGSETWYLYP
jgi:3-oxoacyl-[acyl-carrier protein] reductase